MMRNNEQSGSVLLALVLVFPALLTMAVVYTSLSVSNLRLSREDQSQTRAQLAADAGADAAIREFNLSNSYTGSGTEVELKNDGKVRTTYQTTVTTIDDDTKNIQSVGKTYRGTASNPEGIVKVNVRMKAVKAGNFSVVTGVGGLFMDNHAKILGGDVFINGRIEMQNSAQIGQSNNPLNVSVAHQICPVPPNNTYPRVCTSGENGQPISMQNHAAIYGTVRANNQTSTLNMTNPGLVSNSGVSPQALPPHDRAQQIANVTKITNDQYYRTCQDNVTRTWEGRLKIEGDVVIQNKCKVIINGDVWITGKFEVQNNNSVIRPADSIVIGGSNTVDSERPTIMVDGANGATIQNSATVGSNSSNKGMQIITYASNASCSPGCNVTGADLYNSRNKLTISLQNGSEAPNSLLYARWSQVELSNAGNVGAVVGQNIRMINSSKITFGASTSGGTTTYVIDNYRRSF